MLNVVPAVFRQDVNYAPAFSQPDPFWAPTAEAVYIAAQTPRTTELTLVQPGGPTFFRLWIDRRAGTVVRLRMITAAHFMAQFICALVGFYPINLKPLSELK